MPFVRPNSNDYRYAIGLILLTIRADNLPQMISLIMMLCVTITHKIMLSDHT